MTTAAPPHPPRTSRSSRRWLAALGIVAVLAAAGWGGWKYWGSDRGADQQYIFATVQRGDIEDLVSATGALQPRDYVDVGAQVSGQLKKIHVEVGSEVKEGELLAEIDAEQSTARVDANRAQYRALQAQRIERETNLLKAERDLQRQKNLMAEEATTAEQLQNADTAARVARAQINSLQAQMEQLQASMRVEEANLKYTRIYAPISGTVVSITARQGQTLNTNQQAPTVLRIADLSTMVVQTQVSEADVSKLRIGMPAYFTTLGSQGRRWWGQLKKLEPTPTVTNNVVLYNALFEVPNPQGNLMTQMTAQVFFIASEARDVLVVPMSALATQRSPAGANRRDERQAGAAAPANAPANAAAPAAGSGPGAAAGGPRPDREAWGRMSEEERQRLRAERMAARAAGGEPAGPGGNAAAPARRPGEAADRPAPGAAPRGSAAPPAAAAPPQPATTPPAPRAPRSATVKVAKADGSIEERQVTIGVSNRVHAQVLSGLEDGDRVVAGVRQPDTPRRATAPAAGATQGMGGAPGMGGMPGPAGAAGMGAAPGGARR